MESANPSTPTLVRLSGGPTMDADSGGSVRGARQVVNGRDLLPAYIIARPTLPDWGVIPEGRVGMPVERYVIEADENPWNLRSSRESRDLHTRASRQSQP